MSQNFDGLKQVFEELNGTEAVSIETLKELITDASVLNDIAFISANDGFLLPDIIKALEERGILLSDSLTKSYFEIRKLN